MLQKYKSGNSVKIKYVEGIDYNNGNKEIIKEYRGIIYKGKRYIIIVTPLIDTQNYNTQLLFNQTPNIYRLEPERIRQVGGARFPKEISKALNEQYETLKQHQEFKRKITQIQEEIYKMETKLKEQSEGLLKELVNNRPEDIEILRAHVRKEIQENSKQYVYHESKNQYLSYSFKDMYKKGTNYYIKLNFMLEANVRLMSKEIEDRIINREGVTQRDIQGYTPDETDLNRLMSQGKVIKVSKQHTIQDKGWVSFYKDIEIEFPIDIKNVATWHTKLRDHIIKRYQMVLSRHGFL